MISRACGNPASKLQFVLNKCISFEKAPGLNQAVLAHLSRYIDCNWLSYSIVLITQKIIYCGTHWKCSNGRLKKEFPKQMLFMKKLEVNDRTPYTHFILSVFCLFQWLSCLCLVSSVF